MRMPDLLDIIPVCFMAALAVLFLIRQRQYRKEEKELEQTYRDVAEYLESREQI